MLDELLGIPSNIELLMDLAEDEGGIKQTAETLKVQLVDKVLKKSDVTLHIFVDGTEGADLPWYLEVTRTEEKGLKGQWKCSDCRPVHVCLITGNGVLHFKTVPLPNFQPGMDSTSWFHIYFLFTL